MGRELFEKWLVDKTDLVEGTISSYGSAITAISKWAIRQNIIHQSIYDIKDNDSLNKAFNLLNDSA